VRAIDPRIPIFVGYGMVAWGMWLGHAVNGEWGFVEFAAVQTFRGVGVMVAMIASTQLTMSTLPMHLIKDASGLLNLARNTAGAVGMAIIASNLTSQGAVHMNDMTSRIDRSSIEGQAMLSGLTQRFAQMGVSDPEGAAYKAMHYMISQKAQILAFGDAFAFMSVCAVAAALLALLARPGKIHPGGRAMTPEPEH
jgi:DHA2 family multidrug resistance protein